MPISKKTIVADAMEAVGQRVQEEAMDELVGVERHDPRLAAMSIVAPAERDAMGVAAEIGQHLLWPAERRLGVDDQFAATDFGKHVGEGLRLCQVSEIAEEARPARIMGHS